MGFNLNSTTISNQMNLDQLDERLRSLEERIVSSSNEVKLQQDVIKSLTAINNRLVATTSNKEKVNSVNSQIETYEKYINNPSLIDKFADDSLVKAEIVLDNEQRIRKQYAMLEKIALKEKIIESKFINDFDTFLPRIQKIRETALKQQEHSRRIQEETKRLLTIYNQLMVVVNEQLANWESKVLSIEQKKHEEENTIKSLDEID